MSVERMAVRRAREWTARSFHQEAEVRTRAAVEFVDLTPLAEAALARSGIVEGIVVVQSQHTTAGVVVNEDEPLLLEDLRAALERAAPRHLSYRHDDLALRAGVP